MLKKALILMSILACSFQAYAMDLNSVLENGDTTSVTIARQRDILAPYKHQSEFMEIRAWLQTQHPDFSEERIKEHPLFPCLIEAMALADFELDVLETFICDYMQTDIPTEQGLSIEILRENALAVKYFTSSIVGVLEGRKTIQSEVEDFLFDRFENIAQYANDLKPKTVFNNGRLCTLTAAPITGDTSSKFLRSYNTKNKIVRDLLYYLKDQDPSPLKDRISPRLLTLIKLSSSLHPFLNKENDTWSDYAVPLQNGELKNFLGNFTLEKNASEADRKKLDYIKSLYSVPKKGGYTVFYDMKTPSFLEESMGSTDKKAKKTKPGQGKRKTKSNKQKPRKNNMSAKEETVKYDEERDSESSEDEAGKEIILEDTPLDAEEVSPPTKILSSLTLDSDYISSNAKVSHTAELHSPMQSSSSSTMAKNNTLYSFTSNPSESARAHTIRAKTSSKSHAEAGIFKETAPKTTIVRKMHIDTIRAIFSPTDYETVTADTIIAAWQAVLQEDGYYEEKTKDTHQHLFADLRNGSWVVFRLFRSQHYGQNYIKYVRDAFDKIGFGRAWLEQNGYRLD